MKKFLILTVIIILIQACSKSNGFQINPDFTDLENQLNKAEITVSTTGSDYYGKTITSKEMYKLITAPSGTGAVTLQYTVTSTHAAKDVKWYIDNALAGSGNNVHVNFENFGDKKLKVTYKDASTNLEYSKELTLRIHKYIVADITLQNLDICGQFSVMGSLKTVATTIDCDKRSLELKDMVFQVSSFNNVLLLIFYKNETITAKLVTIAGNLLNNFTPGTYNVNNGTVVIK